MQSSIRFASVSNGKRLILRFLASSAEWGHIGNPLGKTMLMNARI